MSGPYERPAPSMGALTFEMILLYVAQFQEIIVPPVEPVYAIDLLMEDRNGVRRLVQRLYVGDAWLSDGRGIAFMEPEDYRRLTTLLTKRYTASEQLDTQRFFADLRRPKEDELPSDWKPQEVSVSEAGQRMIPSDWDPFGYDPGATIRPRPAGWRNLRRDATVDDESLRETKAVSVDGSGVPAAEDNQVVPSQATAEEPEESEQNIAPQPDSVQSEEPIDAPESAPENVASPSTDNNNRRQLFLVLIALTVFAVVKLLGSQRWRE